MKFIITLCLCALSFLGFSQLFQPKKAYTRQDSLRGSITPERAWWNLQYYHLSVKVQPNDSTISGNNLITYKVLKPAQVIQIDLQNPMQITKVVQDGQSLKYKREGNAFFVELQKKQVIGKTESITVFYEGKPRVARRPPWDGGFSWKKDSEGKWFITTSCQGLGASVWWPCKDHMYDEADSMLISITVPKGLQDISNGRLLRVVDNPDETRTFDWFVANPINNYGVNINIGNYVHFSEKYKGLKGDLDCNYYVLPEDFEKAKVQFKQVPMMLKAFEHWFGPYPFYEDGYKLVQVSYLGMEHQSSVTYGNHFTNGYLGRDLSGTGWGLKWDFIIIHESGHEWFANNITDKDIADMWIHESFTNYSENLFTEYYYGKEAGATYVKGCRKLIGNKEPIIGDYEVNQGGSGDMYYKGGNMLHTIRQIIDNDEKWRQILVGLNKDFYHQTVDTKQIESYITKKSGINLSKVFGQYLRNTEIPTLEYKVEKGVVSYRWTTCIDGFNMPIKIENATGKYQFIQPTTTWKSMKGIKDIKIDENFYVYLKKV